MVPASGAELAKEARLVGAFLATWLAQESVVALGEA